MGYSVRMLDSSLHDELFVPKHTKDTPYLISNIFAFIDVNAFLVAIAFITLLARTSKIPWGVATDSILVAKVLLTLINILADFLHVFETARAYALVKPLGIFTNRMQFTTCKTIITLILICNQK